MADITPASSISDEDIPPAPALSFDGTDSEGNAILTLTGSDDLAINTILTCPANGNEWVESASLTGNGSVSVTLEPGCFWAQAKTLFNGLSNCSTAIFLGIASGGDDLSSLQRQLIRNSLLADTELASLLGSYQGVFYITPPADAQRPWITFEISDNYPSDKGGYEFTLSLMLQCGELSVMEDLYQRVTSVLSSLPLENESWSIRRMTPQQSPAPSQNKHGNWQREIRFAVHAHLASQTMTLTDTDGNICLIAAASAQTACSLQRLQGIRESAGGSRIVNDHGYSQTTLSCKIYSLLTGEYQQLENFYNGVMGAAKEFTLEQNSVSLTVTFSDKPLQSTQNSDGTYDVNFELWSR